ncbi:MAG: hypothetical protein H6R10_2099 [Rhodocyclaceae bacterium]|nr:hypothetical protein [Rhodocyclaceae bacterium]
MVSELPSRQTLAARAGVAARFLALGSVIDRTSLAFLLLALATLLWTETPPPAGPALLVAVIAGLGEKYFALRVAFDRDVFKDWAEHWEKSDFPAPEADLAAFDAGLGHPAGGPPRPLEDRVCGALGLLKWQAAFALVQILALLAAVLPKALSHLVR